MSDFRFILQPYKGPDTRHECPSCHRQHCFSRYIDTEGKVTFPDTVGRCDHEQSCGYHYTPKQYFLDNPEVKAGLADHQPKSAKVSIVPQVVKSKPEPYFFEATLMAKTEVVYDHNALCSFLCERIERQIVVRHMRMYHAGAGKSGATAYWQIDINGRIRDCKIMVYDATTGHRSKDPQQHVTWLHSIMGIDKDRISQCFFGEHLISHDQTKRKPIAIVESEKTAIIASIYFPVFIWIATGGKDGMFSQANFDVLRGHKVILFPDLGMLDNWHEKAITLVRHGIDATVYDFLESRASEEDKKAGLDIADFLLQGKMLADNASGPKEIVHEPNVRCRQCESSHESINGTFCEKLKRYVEHDRWVEGASFCPKGKDNHEQ